MSLIISRKSGELFWIGDQIKVTVKKIDGNRVRVEVDAPREVPILRQELLEPVAANAEVE